MRRLLALVLTGVALTAAPANAQGAATLRGVVYDCYGGGPIGGSWVGLRNLVDGSTTTLTAGEDGRFLRVGIDPGLYLISAHGPVPSRQRGRALPSQTVSRLARIESDDVLDVRIGTSRTLYGAVATPSQRETSPASASQANAPAPLCDPALVPRAPSTSSRYIIR
jgi:hypothetical protein